jgi:hypothetical protein
LGALERALDGEDHMAIKLDAKLLKVPFIVGTMNANISRDRQRRRIGICINGIIVRPPTKR